MTDTHQHKNLSIDGRPIHPNSLEAMGRHDPRIADAIRRGRKAQKEQEKHLKAWARQGFSSASVYEPLSDYRASAEKDYPERVRSNGHWASEDV